MAHPASRRRRARSREEPPYLMIWSFLTCQYLHFSFYFDIDLFASNYGHPEAISLSWALDIVCRLVCLISTLVYGGFTVYASAIIYDGGVRIKLRRFRGQNVSPRLGISWKLERAVVEKNKGSLGKDEEEVSPICLEDVTIGFGYVRLRDYMHKFHRDCIAK